MKEDFLHYYWQHKVKPNKKYRTTNGSKIEIIYCGEKNTDAGPDFFNAKIKIDDELWAGNVEIHLKASNWTQHNHHNDAAYNNVILHVVEKADKEIKTANGRTPPCLELKNSRNHFEKYAAHFEKKEFIPCEEHLSQIDEFKIRFWLEKVLIERWESHYNQILKRFAANNNSWEETFYQLLTQNFGLKANKEPFEQLARSLPLKILAKHKNSLLQLEALLFGQAGFFGNSGETDEYTTKRKKEYFFLKHKYKLKNINAEQWKFLRLRPANFPTIRLAQLASLIHNASAMFSKVLEADSLQDLRKLLAPEASSYWDSHYNFGKKTHAPKSKKLGKQMQDLLLINTFLPTLFVYGLHYGKQNLKDKALNFLYELPSEKNQILESWKKAGIKSKSAFYSQALLQLKKNYCNFNHCLKCSLGHQILTNHIE